MEADISQLEAPTFTTISRGPPEPMLRLKWDHKVSLIGEKVLNPMIHCCDQCDKPILVYGRMIPCKHIFCLKCARQEPIKNCPRCKDKVLRVEQSGLGTVFMCTHGGSRYGNNGCRRTYLSQRDLQAHINHRHVTPQQPLSTETVKTAQILDNKALNILPRKPVELSVPSSATVPTSSVATRIPQRASAHQFAISIPGAPVSVSSVSSSIQSSSRTNLINVPIQEAQQALAKGNIQQQVTSTVVSNLNSSSVHHHGSAAEQVASASYYSNALLSYSGPNRPHAHSSTHTSSSHAAAAAAVLAAQNYGGISSIGSQNAMSPLVPPPAHLSSQSIVPPPPPPPAPPQAPAYYAAYGQQYGQIPHYQFDQSNYPSGASNPQWNQQQYYR